MVQEEGHEGQLVLAEIGSREHNDREVGSTVLVGNSLECWGDLEAYQARTQHERNDAEAHAARRHSREHSSRVCWPSHSAAEREGTQDLEHTPFYLLNLSKTSSLFPWDAPQQFQEIESNVANIRGDSEHGLNPHISIWYSMRGKWGRRVWFTPNVNKYQKRSVAKTGLSIANQL